jgi:hypothetical protein
MPNRKGYWAEGRLFFLALLPEIEAALAKARSLRGFHEEHKARLHMSYPQLARYWRAYKASQVQKASPAGKPASAPSKPELDHHSSKVRAPEPSTASRVEKATSTGSEKKRDFHYDPMDAYRYNFGIKEDGK